MAPVRAVLWDADGVLQQTAPGVWDLAREVIDEFPGALTGTPVDEHRINAVIDELGLAHQRAEIIRVWSAFEPLPESRQLLASVRSAGTPCYLATNQDAYRAACMRRQAAYDDLLDGSYYSCDLGVAKPEPAFFHHVADDLGVAPGSLLFLDDQPENVESARRVGLRAEQWHHSDGIDALALHLAAHRVPTG
jgi:putative hydrolase of the HAD superfamily